jgi:hypothetical protein
MEGIQTSRPVVQGCSAWRRRQASRDSSSLSAARLASLTADQYRQIVERSIEDYAQGEAEPEPLPARALHGDPTRAATSAWPAPASAVPDRLGVLAGFFAGRG